MGVKYLIKGKLYDPILFGDEDDDWVGDSDKPTCGDCGVHVGEKHLDMCDIERCPACGLQFITCACGVKYELDEKDMKFLDKYIAHNEEGLRFVGNQKLQKLFKKPLQKYKQNHTTQNDSEM